MTDKELAKIYYLGREVKDVEIWCDDLHYIDIGSAVDITGKDRVTQMEYVASSLDKDENIDLVNWDIEDPSDIIKIRHTELLPGVMIEWLSAKSDITKDRSVKSSLFIPMTKIVHIIVDNPEHNRSIRTKGVIEK